MPDINQFRTGANSKEEPIRSPFSLSVEDEFGNMRQTHVRKPAGPSAEVMAARKANMEKQGVRINNGARGRDVGGGRRELDPSSLGIVDRYVEREKSDAEKILEKFDTEVQSRFDEDIALRKQMTEELGRVPTEDEVLDRKGLGYINKVIADPKRISTLADADADPEELRKRFEKKEADYAAKEEREAMEKQLANSGESADEEDEYGVEEEIDYDAAVANLNLPGMEDVEEGDYITDAAQLGILPEDNFDDESETYEEGISVGFDEEEEMAQERQTVNFIENDEVEEEFSETPAEEEVVESDEYLQDYVDEDDIDEEAEAEEKEAKMSRERAREIRELLRQDVRDRLRPAATKFDFSTFTVSGNTTLSKSKPVKKVRTADWPLFNTGRPIKVTSMSALELDSLIRAATTDDSPYMERKKRYQILFDHVVSPKPKTVEEWLKSISFKDKDHLWFAWYVANFSGTNYYPATCPSKGCGRKFLTEDVPVSKMVKFKDPARGRRAYQEIMSMSITEQKAAAGFWTSEIVPVSEKYAIAFKDPSMYDIVLEPALVGDDEVYYRAHQGTIVKSTFIKAVYEIDYVNSKFVEINFTTFPGKATKTYKAKIHSLEQIFSTFTSTEMSVVDTCISLLENTTNIDSLMDLMDAKSDAYKNRTTINDITYVYPETVCPDCGEKVPEQRIEDNDVERALFTRHQLAVLAM